MADMSKEERAIVEVFEVVNLKLSKHRIEENGEWAKECEKTYSTQIYKYSTRDLIFRSIIKDIHIKNRLIYKKISES